MEIQINVQAPGLVKAIESLAAALSGNQSVILPELTPTQQIETQPAVPVQQSPIQQPFQQQQVPQGVPVQQAPIQNVPVQHPPMQQPVHQAVPTQAPTYSMDQLAVAATQLMDTGKRNELLQLLSSFGVQALTALPQEQYGSFATKLRELGANI